jgi:hypothetical protein
MDGFDWEWFIVGFLATYSFVATIRLNKAIRKLQLELFEVRSRLWPRG